MTYRPTPTFVAALLAALLGAAITLTLLATVSA
jgi:hypothetical protein